MQKAARRHSHRLGRNQSKRRRRRRWALRHLFWQQALRQRLPPREAGCGVAHSSWLVYRICSCPQPLRLHPHRRGEPRDRWPWRMARWTLQDLCFCQALQRRLPRLEEGCGQRRGMLARSFRKLFSIQAMRKRLRGHGRRSGGEEDRERAARGTGVPEEGGPGRGELRRWRCGGRRSARRQGTGTPRHHSAAHGGLHGDKRHAQSHAHWPGARH